jgi:hypothetical protein
MGPVNEAFWKLYKKCEDSAVDSLRESLDIEKCGDLLKL